MKMIDVSKVRVFRVCLFVLFMLFMRIGWASNDDSTYNIVDFGAKGDGITDNTQFINTMDINDNYTEEDKTKTLKAYDINTKIEIL